VEGCSKDETVKIALYKPARILRRERGEELQALLKRVLSILMITTERQKFDVPEKRIAYLKLRDP